VVKRTIDDQQGDETMFKVNESKWDRIIRVVLGIVLLILGLTVGAGIWWGIVLDIIGAVLILTGVTGFCLIYRLFNISTSKA
jgi:Inner membrane protein YgaP-like, transmembrane domain